MSTNILDNHLVKKNLKQLLLDVQKAGYQNSYMYKKGYIIVNKNSLVKVRIALDKDGQSVVSTVPLGAKEILFNIALLMIFLLIGGFFVVLAIGYVLVSGIAFLISLPKSREFKTEIENIISLSPPK